MWVYVESERGYNGDEGVYYIAYTVGFYGPDGHWHSDSDHATRDEAAARVSYLNGGGK